MKYVIMALTTLMICIKAFGCPTCLGRLKLGIKKPFFEIYRPRSRSIYSKRRDDLMFKALSHKKTGTSALQKEPKRFAERKEKEV